MNIYCIHRHINTWTASPIVLYSLYTTSEYRRYQKEMVNQPGLGVIKKLELCAYVLRK